MKAGIICSTGGSALFEAINIFQKCNIKFEPTIVVDRECGAYDKAKKNGFEAKIIKFNDKNQFSTEAANYFQEKSIVNILLLYTRLVGEPLISEFNICNIHPALLPSYKGIGAVKMAKESGSLLLGCTLHKVDEGMDTGQVIAHVITDKLQEMTIDKANKLSFLQKIWLIINWYEMNSTNIYKNNNDNNFNLCSVKFATHAINKDLFKKYIELEKFELSN